MSHQPIVVDAFDTVQEAAQRMRANVIGALPVVEGGELVGIVTDRDLAMRVVAPAEPPWETYVREVMTRKPAICRRDEPLEAAIERMVSARVRRLIVVDEDGAVAGMVSVDDLVVIEQTCAMALRVLRQLAAMRGELDGTFAGMQP
jgi:CBS domain-containing protein